MPRLRNRRTGVVVNVDDDTASRLGADWVDPKAPAEAPKAPVEPVLTPDGASKGEPASPAPEAPHGNAGRAKWAEYADSLGVEYSEGDDKVAIQAAIDAHVPAAGGDGTEGEEAGE